MSQRRSSSPSGMKLPKSRKSLPSSPDSTDRTKGASETVSCTAKLDTVKNQSKMERSNNSKMGPLPDDNFDKTEMLINAMQSSSAKTPDKTLPSERSDAVDKEDELADVLTRHIYLAENQMRRMQLVLKRAEERLRVKDQEISRLKRKIKDCEAKSTDQDTISQNVTQKKKSEVENAAYLYKRCLGLEHKIFEMEKFLADYGLVWIGDSKATSGKDPNKAPNDFIKNCYAQLTANIEELNISVGKNEIQVELNQDGGGASFKTPSCMCLRFYKNGMVIEDGKLRPYNDPNTVSFIRDILDGYFPSELQKSYPNGVPFQVEDHRKETYVFGAMDFPGQGYRLGKQALVGKKASTSTVKSIASVHSSNVQSSKSPIENKKKCSYSFKTGMPVVPSSARASNQRICPSSMSVELLDLRSQILASHNNTCSHSHLQSHVNAELGLGIRAERKRMSAAKTTEYHMSVKEKSASSKGSHADSACLSSRRGKTSQHGSVDRSSLGYSSSRLEKPSVRTKSRPRSMSLNSARFPIRVGSRFASPTGNEGTARHCYPGTSGSLVKPRITRSATLDRKNELPIVREINPSTGKPGELRLKVRSMNGSTVFLAHLSADDSVGRLYQLLDKALVKRRQRSYKIIVSGYERKRLDQFGIPLREYGISRDSVLHLVND